MRYEIRFLAIIIIIIIVGGCEMNSERALKDITTSTFETKQISKGNIIQISTSQKTVLIYY